MGKRQILKQFKDHSIAILVGLGFTLFSIMIAWNFLNTPMANRSGWVLNLLDSFHAKSTDLKLKFRGPIKTSEDLAVIAIDDRSLKEVGRWPWDRMKMARLIEELFKYQVKSVALDVLFTEPSNRDATEIINGLKEINSQLSDLSKQKLQKFTVAKSQRYDHDQLLAKTFIKFRNRLVSSTAYEIPKFHFKPYQFQCFNIALEQSSQFNELDQIGYNVIRLSSPFDNPPIAAELAKELETKLSTLESDEEKFMYCKDWLKIDDPSIGDWETNWDQLSKNNEKLKSILYTEYIKSLRDRGLHSALSHVHTWLFNISKIHENTDWVGFLNFEPGIDGVVREIPLLVKTGPYVLPSLSLASAILHLQGDGAQYSRTKNLNKPNEFKITSIDITKEGEVINTIYSNDYGKAYINFLGPSFSFPHINASDLLKPQEKVEVRQVGQKGEIQQLLLDKKEALKGKTVIIGATALGAYDLRVTPFDKNYPGVEAHLTSLENIVNNRFFRPIDHNNLFTLFSILALGLALSLILSISSSVTSLITVILVGSGLSLYDYHFLFKKNYISTIPLIILFLGVLYATITIYRYFGEERKKKAIRGTFEKYVSPSIVSEVLEDPENLQLGGRKEFMSVFFSDIRGFTTISESLDPQDLSDLLNIYLTPMTQLVFKNNGTLDKYMGDAVMAFFGAPVKNTTHAEDACRCALDQMYKLNELNAELSAKGMINLEIGIGINTGEMSVGNMGSQTVRNYTVMGDAVNLGSRLEGINKNYGTHIIISEFTEKLLGTDFQRREIDWVKVKGKNEPVKIFELIGEGELHSEIQTSIDLYKTGYELYRKREFKLAKSKFDKAIELSNDHVSQLYTKRCAEYIKTPPDVNWDGVFVMKTK